VVVAAACSRCTCYRSLHWQLVSVASTIFDDRSFRLNEEASLDVCDKAIAEP
jgi:hypothetical protein